MQHVAHRASDEIARLNSYIKELESARDLFHEALIVVLAKLRTNEGTKESLIEFIDNEIRKVVFKK